MKTNAKNSKNKNTNKKGFTVIEMVTVIAVIAILAAVLIPTFTGIIASAEKSATLQEARNNFTDAYAQDFQDGVIDAKVYGEEMNYDGYEIQSGLAHYTYSSRGYTAIYDGTEWTITEEE